MRVETGRQFQLGRLSVDRVTFAEALDAITGLVRRRRGGMVFTPNVDHVVRVSDDAPFRCAYEAADLSLADGMPVVWASRLLRQPLPEKISGSDLAPLLIERAASLGFRVYLLGGAAGVAETAARKLLFQHPRLKIAGTACPHIDLAGPVADRAHVVAAIRKARPDLVLVSFGAPKQELWMHESAAALRPAVLLGVGASIDFLAGTVRRAPAWMSRAGLEWLYRLGQEPRRLWRRYLLRGPRFLGILAQELRLRRRARALEMGP